MTKGQVSTTYLWRIKMTSFYDTYIATNRATRGGVSFTKATTFLKNPETIWEYYQTNLNNVRKAEGNPNAEKRCVKAVKELPNGKWRLKLQTGKYAHPLLIDDTGIANLEIKDFSTKEDALTGWQVWIDNLRNKDRGIRRAIADAYKSYAVKNDCYNEDSFDAFFNIEEVA